MIIAHHHYSSVQSYLIHNPFSPVMNLAIRFCQNTVVLPLAAIVLIAAATSSHAVIVNIDPSQSSVTYHHGPSFSTCDLQGICVPPSDPQTFILSGNFNVIQEVPVWLDSQIIRFDTLAVDSGGAAVLGFSFPTYAGLLMNEGDFIASNDPCFLLSSTTSCTGLSMGGIDNFSGTFDGATLSMTGDEYISGSFYHDRFSFTIVAQVGNPLPVPEPETYAMLMAGLGVLGWRVRRETARPPR